MVATLSVTDLFEPPYGPPAIDYWIGSSDVFPVPAGWACTYDQRLDIDTSSSELHRVSAHVHRLLVPVRAQVEVHDQEVHDDGHLARFSRQPP